jgi:hypothetical protein
MRLDYLIDYLRDHLARERVLLRRIGQYIAPLLLLPVGFALAQISHGGIGLFAGGISAAVLLAQIDLFLRPSLARIRTSDQDARYYLGLAPAQAPSSLVPVVPLMAPSALALVMSMALFLPSVLADAPTWQRALALVLGLGTLWVLWQRFATIATLLDSLDSRLTAARPPSPPTLPSAPVNVRPPARDGLLEPALSQRINGLPMPVLPLSPAAHALLLTEVYVRLREQPDVSDRELLAMLNDLAHEAHHDEISHWLLPPVGGKLYLPVTAGGALASLLGATARRLGMDGAYSATLGTWLVRLPPARSYRVAGRLLDAVVALGLPPAGAVLPHHLTVQGNLGQEAKTLSLIHLAAMPLIMEERTGHAGGDERPFVMSGGGVLDDMGGRGRSKGPRTDFVDGFLLSATPGMNAVEHLVAHTTNLRIKQVLAYGLASAARRDQLSPVEQQAARMYTVFRADLRALLQRYDLAGALDVRWLDGRWSDVWPFIMHMNDLKQRDPHFLEDAQALRDCTLDDLERLVVRASGARRG